MDIIDQLTENGIRIVRCLQSLLLAEPVRTGINTYIKRFPEKTIGYEALLKSYMHSRLSALYGEDKVYVEHYTPNKKEGENHNGFHDFFIKSGDEGVAIEVKAYKKIKSFKMRYQEDLDGLLCYLKKGITNEKRREAFFIHYNHTKECDQTAELKKLLNDTKSDAKYAWKMMLITGGAVVDPNGITRIRDFPNFFLAYPIRQSFGNAIRAGMHIVERCETRRKDGIQE